VLALAASARAASTDYKPVFGNYAPRVANTGALNLLSVNPAVALGVVRREGYSASGDGGAADYTHSASSCAALGKASDNGACTPASDGGSWLLVSSAVGVDVRVWGAKCVGSSNDDTSAINAALAFLAAASIPARFPHGCYSASGIVAPNGSIIRGETTQVDAPSTPLGSSITCGAGVAYCVKNQNGNSWSGFSLKGVAIVGTATSGTGAASVYTGKGLFIQDGSNIDVSDFLIGGFSDCLTFYGDATNGSGIAAHVYNGTIGGCKGNFIVQNDWPELRLEMIRFGFPTQGFVSDVTGSNAYLYLTGLLSNGAGGPNGLQCYKCQFNTAVANTAPASLLDFGTTVSGQDIGSVSIIGAIADATAGGMAQILKFDSGFQGIFQGLEIQGYFNTPGVKLLNYDPAAIAASNNWHVHDSTFQISGATWSFPCSVVWDDLQFTNNYINAGSGTITVCGAAGSRGNFSGLHFDGSVTPTLSGTWYNFSQSAGEVAFTFSSLSVTNNFKANENIVTGETLASAGTVNGGNYQLSYLTGNTTVTNFGPTWPGRVHYFVPVTAGGLTFSSAGSGATKLCVTLAAAVGQLVQGLYDATNACWRLR
jgi:hypothetical protein